jgi:membrane-associated protease RseP (regulator of RpoE activity)
MKLWLLLIILSPITYFIVKRNIRNVTTTPVWLCWLAIMLPAFIWTAWAYLVGEEQPLPLALVLFPLILCPLLYGWLIQRGKLETPTESTTSTDNPSVDTTTEEMAILPTPINPEEEAILRNCFPWNVYYLQNIDYRPQAIFCRGKLKTIPEEAYDRVKNNIDRAFGDRFFLIFQESFRGNPFFALVPNPQAATSEQEAKKEDIRPAFALAFFVITLITTTLAGMKMSGINPESSLDDLHLVKLGLVYSLPLLIIIGVHELAHYFVATYYKIRTTLPYFVPFPFFLDTFSLGTLGAFVQKRSPVPHRRALFDIAIVGPCVGFLATLPVLLWGLSLSEAAPLPKDNILDFQAFNPRLSFLLSVLAKLILGGQLKPGVGIDLHPLAIAGCVGLLITALNLMPMGQLDGGNIVHAVFGQKVAIAVGQITRILVLLFALVYPYFWFWAIVLWFTPLIDRPALNDVTELNNWRDLGCLLALTLLLSIVLPLPVMVANWLNI